MRSSEYDTTLFRNVRIFDGRSPSLSPTSDVLVRGATIERIATDPIGVAHGERRQQIDGDGRVLMPGLIDAHWHAMMASLPLTTASTADTGYLNLVAGQQANRTLHRGFTTVRDAGGPVFGLKQAIDDGIIEGPRIFPSGAFITQTSGHGDFRMRHELSHGSCGHLSHIESMGVSTIADGVDAVLRAVREQLMLGATQIKMMAGGGVASSYDPVDVTQYTDPELRAGVAAAENWGTYVMVHAFTPRAVQQSLRAGVRCIEHGFLLDDATAEMIAERDAWWCLQPLLDDEDAIPFPYPDQRAKFLQITAGTDHAFGLAKKHGVKIAWGTDILFDGKLADRQGAMLAKMSRWFPAADVLRLATSENAALCAMSGARNPYKGRLGVVEEGALADLLLVDGDPLADLALLADPDRSLVVIMKNGNIFKDNTGSQS
ncbi:amidohydrolase family protein [Mycobacterium sp. URHB0021]|jgi:imidazolonepropionase-like amidohydrolase